MTALLDRILQDTRSGLAERRDRTPAAALEARAQRAPKARDFLGALRGGGVRLIAELKARSPSANLLRNPYDVAELAKAYARAGASAISVLTEPHYFGGSLAHLDQAGQAGLPVLRKDFIVDAYQVLEARANGADAVLLIVRLLSDAELREFLGLAGGLGMAALVEAHNAEELERALAAGAVLIGINSRNLDTLAMDPKAFERLVPRIPKDKVIVAESGIKTPQDVQALKSLGVSGVLVGESLLRQQDLEAAARLLVAAGK